MNPILKNVLAVIFGLVAGSILNMLIVWLSEYVIPPPAGADMTTPEGLKASMHLMQPRHFIMPFLAHALGTFAGAYIAASMAANHNTGVAIGIGVLFLVGGIAASFMIPAPAWFIATDLVLAYLPMAWLGGMLATQRKTAQA